MIRAKALQKGDTIATISPSWGCAGSSRVRWKYELGCERLRELGLNVVAAPNSLRGTKFLRDNPEARADDVNWAFENKEVKAVIANIGGNDSEKIIPFLSEKIIRDNPKILVGYSDVLSLHLYCMRLGLVTFYGDNLLTDIAENPAWHPYSRESFEKTFFDPAPVGKIEPSEDWSYGADRHTDKNYKKEYVPNPGYITVQGKGSVEGKLFGGHSDLLKIKDKDGKSLVRKDDFEGSIFFFEDIPECMDPDGMAAFFDILGQKGYLEKIKGIIIGKMRMPSSFDPYASKIREVITGKYKLSDLPVMAGLNFGHTSPVFILPYGAQAKLDMDDMSFSISESGVEGYSREGLKTDG